MNKNIKLSLATIAVISSLNAQDLGTVKIEQSVTQSKIVENIDGDRVKSADLAEALHNESASINLIRRSGIANDITLRGQKRDNIVVTIDDGKVCGACPNRMDPPTSHVVVSNVENVEVNEGPFDVEEFGNLSGSVKVQTKKPSKELSGEVYVNMGSFGYKKAGATISGGNDTVQVMVTASKEESDQYEDGDGNTLAQQTQNYVYGTATPTDDGNRYSATAKDMKAFEKQTVMTKANINITDNQALEVSVTQNRSDNILYANSGMDALYDDSNIYNVKYTAKELGSFSKKFEIKAYKSDVDHPMDITLRDKNRNAAKTGMTNHLTTDTHGIKVINTFDAIGRTFDIGLDTNYRNWDGKYYKDVNPNIGASIKDTDTVNNALFLKCNNKMGAINIALGLRYNDTTIDTAEDYVNKDFNSLDANIIATYKTDSNAKYFVAIGKASRVPDARELYFKSLTQTNAIVMRGTPTLDQTTNTEIDLGVQKNYENGMVKAKAFYSSLDNYVYFKKGATTNAFQNIDASIYGIELNSEYDMTENLFMDFSAAYTRG
ncbi:MAG: TonB-dependent receptor, partial [Campylobacterales bacterium]|nr:TonB-dependent receptor [Campylobacterales bacterium]